MAKKKIVGSYQHNVYVSAKTKQEFKKNKEQFKQEGIRSAYSLQKHKNIISKMEAIEKAERRQVVVEAYKLEERKFKAQGYSLESFLEDFETIEKQNKKIKQAIKKGKILKDSATLSFPISRDTGKINIKRLNKMLSKAKLKISEIATEQRTVIFNNIDYLWGQKAVDEIKEMLAHVDTTDIYSYFANDEWFNMLVRYDVDNFTTDNKKVYWDNLKAGYNKFRELCEDLSKRSDK